MRALAVALGPLVVLAGCSAEVALEAPSPSPQDARACAALTADLPATVAGQAARDVAGTEQAPSLLAAWGTPPITLRCGVVAPPSLTATSQCYEVDGVGWFAEQAPDGFLFTTIGRQVFVEVGVPSRYAPEADVLIELAAPVTDHDPVLQPCV